MIRKIFLLYLIHLSTQVCSPDQSETVCNCLESFNHKGIVYLYSERFSHFVRYSSPEEACQPENINRSTRSLLYNQQYPYPDIGARVSFTAGTFLTTDLHFSRSLITYQFSKIWEKEMKVCTYDNPNLQHKGRRMTGVDCVFDIEIYLHRRWVTVNGGDDKDSLSSNLNCSEQRSFSFEDTKPERCEYYECLEKIKNKRAPFTTEKETFATKEHYCKASIERKSDILILVKSEGTKCKGGETMVCVDDVGPMSRTDFCKYKEQGYAYESFECPGGCRRRDCQKTTCMNSFKGKFSTIPKVCAVDSGVMYNNADEFCDNTPFYSVYYKQKRTNDSFFPNIIDFSDEEIKDQEECCTKNDYFYCDADDEYKFKKVSQNCFPSHIESRRTADNFYFPEKDQKMCILFKKCMTIIPDVDGLCFEDGSFYDSRREYCINNIHNFQQNKLHNCSNNTEEGQRCDSPFKCRYTVNYEMERDFTQVNCTTAMQLSWDINTISTSRAFNKDIIMCGEKPCGFAECMMMIKIEERNEDMLVLCPEKELYDSPKELHPYQVENTVSDKELIYCKDDCTDFPSGFQCVTTSNCIEMSVGASGRRSETSEIMEQCKLEMSRNDRVCDFNNEKFEPTFYKSVDKFCEAAIARGIKEKFRTFTLDCYGCGDVSQCTSNQCFQNKFNLCLDGETVVSPNEFCLKNPSFLKKKIIPCETNGIQRDCYPTDCCSKDPEPTGFYNTNCSPNGLVLFKESKVCSEFNNIKEQPVLPVVVSPGFKVCDKDKHFFDDAESFCAAKKSFPNLVVSHIFSREEDGPLKCCNYNCPVEQKLVIMNDKNGKERVFQNQCFADCHTNVEFGVKKCKAGEERKKCKVRNCVFDDKCYKDNNGLVCAEDGMVYQSKCEVVCQELKAIMKCPPGSENNINMRNECFKKCRELKEGTEGREED